MWKRMLLMLAAAVVLVAGLGFIKFRQIQAGMSAAASFQPPPEAVTTVIARQERWQESVSLIGTVQAVQGVNVSADLPGIVSRIAFESGEAVEKGQVLAELDTRQEQAQLAAAQSERNLAELNFKRLDGLVSEGAISKSEYDRAAAQQKQTEARVDEIRATMERKTIRAPFAGVLGLRKVNLGQYLSPGDALVALQSFDPIYVNFGVPQQRAGEVRVGQTVRITAGERNQILFEGRVTSTESTVDESTRNLQIQATVSNPKRLLRPGMFVQVEMPLGGSHTVLPLPASAVSYAPYGNSVFVVTELKDDKGQKYRGVRQQFVKVEGARGDQVGVMSGVKPGDEVVTSGVFKLRNGSAVQVNNKVKPTNSPAPKPEDS
ncbi:MAG: efflux RND transporter periplasmic adaptor subunit [Bryobacteraceae bacterium]|nr:efflux RND transporter periplasmic adaptor subunit [Bryobacteraceae bacterium]